MNCNAPIIRVEGVEKSFGSTVALAGVDLTVEGGTVFGLLGGKGAGKTTLARILATLLRPDKGRVAVADVDVVRRGQIVRPLIGYSGQNPAIDHRLTGRENLEAAAGLHGMRPPLTRRRTDEVIDRLSLTLVADRVASTYTAGLRRRLDFAASLIGWPVLLIMDEPTAGVDPDTRDGLWLLIEQLVRDGMTVFLTSRSPEELDRLADQIVVIERGRLMVHPAAAAMPTG